MKIPVITTPEYVLYLEEYQGNMFVHCDLLVKWTKEVKQRLQEAFNILSKEYGKELYALHTPEDKKHKKFLQMFGFVYCASFIGTDGKEYEIYIWR
jgi:hypothetical protein